MVNVADHLREDRRRLDACLGAIEIIQVNPQTLLLYEVSSFEELLSQLPQIIGAEATEANVDQIAALFRGDKTFSGNVINYSVSGRRLSIRLRGTILPGCEDRWERVLLAAEDVTELQAARALAERHQEYAQTLFEHSPVALWVIDCSGLRKLAEQVVNQYAKDGRLLSHVSDETALQQLDKIVVVDINLQTMNLYSVHDKTHFVAGGYRATLITEELDFFYTLLALFKGSPFQEREARHRRCDNSEVYVHQQIVVLPGCEGDWSRVQIAETDITLRKKAESHIKHLRDHDGLTHLYSRDFFYDELVRLTETGTHPVSIIIVDLNGLKQTNDIFGHSQGDDLLRHVGELLNSVTPKGCTAARIGGDEFAVLLPEMNEDATSGFVFAVIECVRDACDEDSGLRLSVSVGAATRLHDEPLTATVGRADADMYKAKLKHYADSGYSRHNSRILSDSTSG